MNYNFIVIEGNIGAGKTSLVTKLSNDINAKPLYEQFNENPFLPLFYNDPQRYSFILEMSFLANRYQQLKEELGTIDMFRPTILADYYFTKSLIFAKSTLTTDEYHLYRTFFNMIYKSLPKPDLYVYLHVNVSKALKNIKIRGRLYEQNIDATYLEKIQDSYYEYFKQQQDTQRVLIIDTTGIDFVNSNKDFVILKETILNTNYKSGITKIVL